VLFIEDVLELQRGHGLLPPSKSAREMRGDYS
jgi:hypothetical protein